MNLKYIMLEQRIGEAARAIPIIFFEPLTHLGMFHAMTETRELCDTTLRSAGFVSVSASNGGQIHCYGESESLKTAKEKNYKSRGDEDAQILRSYSFLFGMLP